MAKIKAIKPHSQTFARDLVTVRQPQNVLPVLQALETCDLDTEHFVVILLDAKHRIRRIDVTSSGTADACIVHPRDVLRPAIEANACAVIVSHNHPSGDPAPSNDDLGLTKRLAKACRIVGITLLDHVIIGGGDHCSLRTDYSSLFEI